MSKPKYGYALRTNDKNNQGYGGFQWPEKGPVECLDWDPKPICGGGLHGLQNGAGDSNLLDWNPDARWQVFRFKLGTEVNIDAGDKIKVPRCEVLHTGNQQTATAFLRKKIGPGPVIHGEIVTTGDASTAITGNKGRAISGERGITIAGNRGTAIAGFAGLAITRNNGIARSEGIGIAIAGYGGTAMVKHGGIAIAEGGGTATAMDGSIVITEDKGTACVGDDGIAIVGDGSIITIGKHGILSVRWWDSINFPSKKHIAVFHADQDFEPDVAYKVICEGENCRLERVNETPEELRKSTPS